MLAGACKFQCIILHMSVECCTAFRHKLVQHRLPQGRHLRSDTVHFCRRSNADAPTQVGMDEKQSLADSLVSVTVTVRLFNTSSMCHIYMQERSVHGVFPPPTCRISYTGP